MRLSEAMMLGSTTCKMVPGDIDSCALGCAGNAVGIPAMRYCPFENRLGPISDRWPWLRNKRSPDREWREVIWNKFDYGVCRGRMTLEQLVDYVRSIEPECGECNQFECSCPKTTAVHEHQEVFSL